ncbi:MAG: hypothetical protein E7D21_04520 [Veillonella sp.]|nr:hypothetical protein [Veillonella sp.]
MCFLFIIFGGNNETNTVNDYRTGWRDGDAPADGIKASTGYPARAG